MTRYTLAQPGRHELVVQRSRFLANAAAAATPEAALETIAQFSSDDAGHHCWAYRIGDAYRSSDDGEPAGTAGRPILAAIDGQGLDRVVVVVARWFGGIKLGAGGLVRAYGGCAAECLRIAPREPLIETVDVNCIIDFALESSVRASLALFGAESIDQRYEEDGLHLRLRIPRHGVEPLRRHLIDLSRGRIVFTVK